MFKNNIEKLRLYEKNKLNNVLRKVACFTQRSLHSNRLCMLANVPLFCFSHVIVACCSLKLILKTYSPLIKQNLAPPARLGVDISGEERYEITMVSQVQKKAPELACVACVVIAFPY